MDAGQSDDPDWHEAEYSFDRRQLTVKKEAPENRVNDDEPKPKEEQVDNATGPGPHVDEPPKQDMCCLVKGCNTDLSASKAYYKRFRICEIHMKSLSLNIEGRSSRFCQQCGKFHPVEEFDGANRNCRKALMIRFYKRRNMPLTQLPQGSGGTNHETDAGGRGGVVAEPSGVARSPGPGAGDLRTEPRKRGRPRLPRPDITEDDPSKRPVPAGVALRASPPPGLDAVFGPALDNLPAARAAAAAGFDLVAQAEYMANCRANHGAAGAMGLGTVSEGFEGDDGSDQRQPRARQRRIDPLPSCNVDGREGPGPDGISGDLDLTSEGLSAQAQALLALAQGGPSFGGLSGSGPSHGSSSPSGGPWAVNGERQAQEADAVPRAARRGTCALAEGQALTAGGGLRGSGQALGWGLGDRLDLDARGEMAAAGSGSALPAANSEPSGGNLAMASALDLSRPGGSLKAGGAAALVAAQAGLGSSPHGADGFTALAAGYNAAQRYGNMQVPSSASGPSSNDTAGSRRGLPPPAAAAAAVASTVPRVAFDGSSQQAPPAYLRLGPEGQDADRRSGGPGGGSASGSGRSVNVGMSDGCADQTRHRAVGVPSAGLPLESYAASLSAQAPSLQQRPLRHAEDLLPTFDLNPQLTYQERAEWRGLGQGLAHQGARDAAERGGVVFINRGGAAPMQVDGGGALPFGADVGGGSRRRVVAVDLSVSQQGLGQRGRGSAAAAAGGGRGGDEDRREAIVRLLNEMPVSAQLDFLQQLEHEQMVALLQMLPHSQQVQLLLQLHQERGAASGPAVPLARQDARQQPAAAISMRAAGSLRAGGSPVQHPAVRSALAGLGPEEVHAAAVRHGGGAVAEGALPGVGRPARMGELLSLSLPGAATRLQRGPDGRTQVVFEAPADQAGSHKQTAQRRAVAAAAAHQRLAAGPELATLSASGAPTISLPLDGGSLAIDLSTGLLHMPARVLAPHQAAGAGAVAGGARRGSGGSQVAAPARGALAPHSPAGPGAPSSEPGQPGPAAGPCPPYAAALALERLSVKLHGCRPEDLAPGMAARLRAWLAGMDAVTLQGTLRSGCVHLVLDVSRGPGTGGWGPMPVQCEIRASGMGAGTRQGSAGLPAPGSIPNPAAHAAAEDAAAVQRLASAGVACALGLEPGPRAWGPNGAAVVGAAAAAAGVRVCVQVGEEVLFPPGAAPPARMPRVQALAPLAVLRGEPATLHCHGRHLASRSAALHVRLNGRRLGALAHPESGSGSDGSGIEGGEAGGQGLPSDGSHASGSGAESEVGDLGSGSENDSQHELWADAVEDVGACIARADSACQKHALWRGSRRRCPCARRSSRRPCLLFLDAPLEAGLATVEWEAGGLLGGWQPLLVAPCEGVAREVNALVHIQGRAAWLCPFITDLGLVIDALHNSSTGARAAQQSHAAAAAAAAACGPGTRLAAFADALWTGVAAAAASAERGGRSSQADSRMLGSIYERLCIARAWAGPGASGGGPTSGPVSGGPAAGPHSGGTGTGYGGGGSAVSWGTSDDSTEAALRTSSSMGGALAVVTLGPVAPHGAGAAQEAVLQQQPQQPALQPEVPRLLTKLLTNMASGNATGGGRGTGALWASLTPAAAGEEGTGAAEAVEPPLLELDVLAHLQRRAEQLLPFCLARAMPHCAHEVLRFLTHTARVPYARLADMRLPESGCHPARGHPAWARQPEYGSVGASGDSVGGPGPTGGCASLMTLAVRSGSPAAVEALLRSGLEAGHLWDPVQPGPDGLAPLQVAAALPTGGATLTLLLGWVSQLWRCVAAAAAARPVHSAELQLAPLLYGSPGRAVPEAGRLGRLLERFAAGHAGEGEGGTESGQGCVDPAGLEQMAAGSGSGGGSSRAEEQAVPAAADMQRLLPTQDADAEESGSAALQAAGAAPRLRPVSLRCVAGGDTDVGAGASTEVEVSHMPDPDTPPFPGASSTSAPLVPADPCCTRLVPSPPSYHRASACSMGSDWCGGAPDVLLGLPASASAASSGSATATDAASAATMCSSSTGMGTGSGTAAGSSSGPSHPIGLRAEALRARLQCAASGGLATLSVGSHWGVGGEGGIAHGVLLGPADSGSGGQHPRALQGVPREQGQEVETGRAATCPGQSGTAVGGGAHPQPAQRPEGKNAAGKGASLGGIPLWRYLKAKLSLKKEPRGQ